MAETGRVFIWVQHLLGIGHLMRAAHLARHLAGKGWQVDLASGGAPIENLDVGAARFHQLPTLRAADSAVSALVDLGGKPVGACRVRKATMSSAPIPPSIADATPRSSIR